jgi:hypothetical protein
MAPTAACALARGAFSLFGSSASNAASKSANAALSEPLINLEE